TRRFRTTSNTPNLIRAGASLARNALKRSRPMTSENEANVTSAGPKRSLSGIKPTGFPHLGNYLGMIRPAIDLQDDYEAFYFVADYHALTLVRDPQALRDSVYQITAYFLAF